MPYIIHITIPHVLKITTFFIPIKCGKRQNKNQVGHITHREEFFHLKNSF